LASFLAPGVAALPAGLCSVPDRAAAGASGSGARRTLRGRFSISRNAAASASAARRACSRAAVSGAGAAAAGVAAGRPAVGRPSVGRPSVGRPAAGRPSGRPPAGRLGAGAAAGDSDFAAAGSDLTGAACAGDSVAVSISACTAGCGEAGSASRSATGSASAGGAGSAGASAGWAAGSGWGSGWAWAAGAGAGSAAGSWSCAAGADGAGAAGSGAGCTAAGARTAGSTGAAGASGTAGAASARACSRASSGGSRLTNTRFLRTSSWRVRGRPVASAWRISEVWGRGTVFVLPSVAPWARRSESGNFAWSLSVTASSTELRSTPAARSCSSSTLAGIFSSVANWATVLLDIRLSSLYMLRLQQRYAGGVAALAPGSAPAWLFFIEPVGPGAHDQLAGLLLVEAGNFGKLVGGQLGQVIARQHLPFRQLGSQFRRHAFEFEQVLCRFKALFLGDGLGK